KMIGAIALSAVLASGIGYGAYSTLTNSDANSSSVEHDEEEYKKDDSPSVEYKKDKDGDYDFEVVEEDSERDFDHLDDVVLAEAEESLEGRDIDHLDAVVKQEAKERMVAGRDLDHLEDIALVHADEISEGTLVRDVDGVLAFEGSKNKDDNLFASIETDSLNGKREEKSSESEEMIYKGLDSDDVTSIGSEPEPEPNPDPKPEPEPEPEPNPDPEPEVDFSELETLLEQVDALEESDYTEESWMDLMNSREVAKFLLDDDDATQDQVDRAKEGLQHALNNLVEEEQDETEDDELESEEETDSSNE